MTILGIVTAVLAAVAILAFLGAAVGMCSTRGQHEPMSPDEEYRWLTEDHGLSHEEAEEVMRPMPRREDG